MPGSNETCSHIDAVDGITHPKRKACEECVEIGASWVHLRTCQECGTTRCCDSSPHRHASAHARAYYLENHTVDADMARVERTFREAVAARRRREA